jgi:hypothetical protein
LPEHEETDETPIQRIMHHLKFWPAVINI